MIVCLFSHALWPDPQPQTRGWNSLLNDTVAPPPPPPQLVLIPQRRGYNVPWHLKGTAEQTCPPPQPPPPHVSGPLALQTDRRKTVACYVINTVIIKIRGVLDSASRRGPLPGTGKSNTPTNVKTKHLLYVQSAEGQKAKASLGVAGVVSVRVSLIFTVKKRKRTQKQPFADADDEFLLSS